MLKVAILDDYQNVSQQFVDLESVLDYSLKSAETAVPSSLSRYLNSQFPLQTLGPEQAFDVPRYHQTSYLRNSCRRLNSSHGRPRFHNLPCVSF